ncbi:MAG: hypothetical protein WC693_06165 [Patescibacteria group bacterium]|jgi:hypothetical protein
MLNKKIYIIIGFVLLTVLIGVGIYFTFFKTPKPVEQPPVTVEQPTGGLPSAGQAGQQPAAPGQVATPATGLPIAKTIVTADLATSGSVGMTLAANGSGVQYYNSNDGLFYKATADGALTQLSNKKFFNVQNVTWSQDNGKAVLEYPDGSNIIYDFASGQQTTIPKHWQDFSFTPAGDKLVAKSIGDSPNSQYLIIADANGNNAKAVAALGANADKVEVNPSPNEQIVAFSNTGDPTGNFGTQEIYLVGQNNENFKSLTVSGFNFQSKWTKEGDRIFYNVTDPNNDYKPALWAADASGDNVGTNAKKINLNTWVDKCAVLAGYKAYCAVPTTLQAGDGFDRRTSETSNDTFYFVDLKTGATTFIGAPDNNYNVTGVSVSPDEKYIFFTDLAAGGVHRMSIK